MSRAKQPKGGAADTPEAPEVTLKIDVRTIVREESLQVRRRLDSGNIKALVATFRSGRKVDPIRIANIGGRPHLIDGWHRVEALLKIGGEQVEAADAVLVPCSSLKEARWLTAQANLNHGKQLSRAEREAAFKAFIGARRHRIRAGAGRGRDSLLSYREIAREIGGVTHASIHRWMRKHYPAIAREMGGDDAVPYTPPDDPIGVTEAAARKTLDEAVMAIQCVRSRSARTRLAAHAQSVLPTLFARDDWYSAHPDGDDFSAF